MKNEYGASVTHKSFAVHEVKRPDTMVFPEDQDKEAVTFAILIPTIDFIIQMNLMIWWSRGLLSS